MKPVWWRKVLQSLHGQFSEIQDLIFFLNSSKEWENLISNGTRFHILGPKNDKDSVPSWTDFTFSSLNS